MQITITAETDEELKRFPKPVIYPKLGVFGVAGLGIGGPIRLSHGHWPDVQMILEGLRAQCEWEIKRGDFKHLAQSLLAGDSGGPGGGARGPVVS